MFGGGGLQAIPVSPLTTPQEDSIIEHVTAQSLRAVPKIFYTEEGKKSWIKQIKNTSMKSLWD